MKRTLLSMALLAASLLPSFAQTAQDYVPTAENIASRQDFALPYEAQKQGGTLEFIMK